MCIDEDWERALHRQNLARMMEPRTPEQAIKDEITGISERIVLERIKHPKVYKTMEPVLDSVLKTMTLINDYVSTKEDRPKQETPKEKAENEFEQYWLRQQLQPNGNLRMDRLTAKDAYMAAKGFY